MKISESGPLRSQPLRRIARTGNGKSTDFATQLGAADEQAFAPSPVTGSAAVGAVDALLSLQEVGDAATGRSKGLQRAANLLDCLDQIRHGLLMGGLSRENLQALADAVSQQRAAVNDPRLVEILDQIEVRAAVELAKYDQTA